MLPLSNQWVEELCGFAIVKTAFAAGALYQEIGWNP